MKDISSFLNELNGMKKNQVFVIIKPGFENIIGTLYTEFKEHGYKIVQMKTKKLLKSEAKELYKVHKDEDFYEALCKYMSSGKTTAFILSKKTKNIFKEFSKLKDKIREKYGESDMRNVIHSSDSFESFEHESSIYFN